MTAYVDPELWKPADDVQLDSETLAILKEGRTAAIVAGPGAGKTELLAQRASFLLETNLCPHPRRILAISFKRDAARNLRERVKQRVGADLSFRLESYTFDAFAKGLVDRFSSGLPAWCRPARAYRVAFPSFRDWSDFALDYGLSGQQLQDAYTAGAWGRALPAVPPEPSSATDAAVFAWWQRSVAQDPARLTFPMIAVLAMTVLHHNPHVIEALRRTYSHVFLDEFQDTTGLQYRLVETCFRGAGTVLTAVGDTKQRIMTWAGALPGNFESFIADFHAERRNLRINFRSNQRIVDIVNSLAASVEPQAVSVSAARSEPAPSGVDGVIHFSNSQAEAESLAQWVANGVSEGLKASDFLFLVRQRADAAEERLKGAFAQHGLSIRNEARPLDGGIAIQELMTEPLSDLIIAVIQMGIGDRTDAPFQRAWDALSDSFGVDEDRSEPILNLENAIRNAVEEVRSLVRIHPNPSAVDLQALVWAIVARFGKSAVRQLAPDYEDAERMESVLRSIIALLKENAATPDWISLVNAYVGRDQVRLMTIHKSKGLEAHSVVLLELQNSSFHSSMNVDEEKFAFFVAASRARERFFVTSTSPQRGRVAALWQMVERAGMREVA